MAVPPGVSAADFAASIARFTEILGPDWVFTSDEDVGLYRDAYSPLWDEEGELVASAAVAPQTVEHVQAVVRIANQYKIPLYPISTGRNLGYGSSSPNLSGSVIVDLKRMNRVIEVDDKRCFCIVEPGVSYFDLYRHITDRGLKVMVDCPDPGWGSPIGNALDHGVGYMMGMYRDHFSAHCGMEVVLANGEVMRTGMGALPNATNFGEFKYGYGPYVDGLFSQGNFGIVTKMGFHMMPEPETFLSTRVTATKQADLIPMVRILNVLEYQCLMGHTRYGSPLGALAASDRTFQAIVDAPGDPNVGAIERYAADRGVAYWDCTLNFYGPEAGVRGNWEHTKDKLSAIPGVKFDELEFFRFPMTPAQQESLRYKVALGIPNLSIFSIGARSPTNPNPYDGHIFFAPILPKTGEAALEAQTVFAKVFRDMSMPVQIRPYTVPSTWMYRTFVLLMNISISRSDKDRNAKVRELMNRLVAAGVERGWAEYRSHPAFQDLVAGAYSFNNHALRRFTESLKDAADPNGILAAGRGGIWPKHLRSTRT